jgi:ABC-2 type transport system ATP-binding protein
VNGNESPIVARGLVRHFGSGDATLRAVDGVDLEVRPGEIFGFLGPNGAGKSTTVRVLTTLLKPTSGSARVAGHDVAREPDAVRRRIGVALQDAAIDPLMTGAELLRLQAILYGLPRNTHERRAGELLERVGLTGAADRRVGTYSGGMRRRLDLAAALVHRPPVLFLDEPTTGLDPRSRTDLWGVIEALVAAGTTLLLTTQYLEEADRLADRIVVIDHGRVIAEGTSSQLKARLGATIVEVGFSDEPSARRAQAELARLGLCDVGTGSHVVELKVDDGARVVLDVVRALDGAGLEPVTISVREPTLDDVFLALTGHHVEEAGVVAPDGEAGRAKRSRGVA